MSYEPYPGYGPSCSDPCGWFGGHYREGVAAARDFMMKCRAEGDYISSDQMRDFITSRGYQVIFEKDGECRILKRH